MESALGRPENDPRVTRVGKVIRLARIDEIPQLFNVLRGDLDLVGPRPERPEFVKELDEDDSLLYPPAHGSPGFDRVGAGHVHVQRDHRGVEGETSIRPVLHQEHVGQARFADPVPNDEDRASRAWSALTFGNLRTIGMCGIAGYVALDGSAPPREPIEPMLASLRHRGPDGFGIYCGDSCVLGHARLSIIDLEGGWQPIFNENREIAITFNGEIYNYIELRRELEASGHRFYTNSDTEVIVHAYEEWGKACPKRFNGQFGFAIYDHRDKTLFLCRDRLGVRPVYYARSGNTFLFASEVKSLKASGLVSIEPSTEGLHQIFTLWTNVYPRTPFVNVFEVPPAHVMIVSPKGIETERYWSLPIGREESLSPGDCIEGLKAHIDRSIRLRLRADVPVGAYLSGGLDSSLTTAFTRQCTSTSLKTFSLSSRIRDSTNRSTREKWRVFSGPSIPPSGSGRRTSQPISGCDPRRGAAHPQDRTRSHAPPVAARSIRGVQGRHHRGGADDSSSDTTSSRKRRCGSIAAGDPSPGSDLFFSGVSTRICSRTGGRRSSRRRSSSRDSRRRPTRSTVTGFASTSRSGFAIFIPATPLSVSTRTLRPACSGDAAGIFRLSPIERTQVVEIETLLSSYLLSSQGDRVAMANSVEGRFVFLDHELIESFRGSRSTARWWGFARNGS